LPMTRGDGVSVGLPMPGSMTFKPSRGLRYFSSLILPNRYFYGEVYKNAIRRTDTEKRLGRGGPAGAGQTRVGPHCWRATAAVLRGVASRAAFRRQVRRAAPGGGACLGDPVATAPSG
jgi:hypothetical protein